MLGPQKWLRNRNRNVGLKIAGIPRDDKKLIIFNIKQTIFDVFSFVRDFYGRPYLHILLGKIYKYYDIGLWSSSSMTGLETQIRKLGTQNHLDYKILFYADSTLMTKVTMADGLQCQAKPLDIIWKQFPEYNASNTLLCDSKEDSFHLNPLNGILVEPYYYDFYAGDDELLKLLPYLEWVAEFKDVRDINHTIWKTRIVADVS
ncbi:hypothetical protein ILUMI_23067 [Ignelater luminosus]|uniref:FCP1 homology domain-containing protein n=1 Tax=Ignelater luminosus TaxID=2038154 RepID=A0A8K0FX35_IGNLU|nr:hypothetical protein ILUMI_23067 [Ignelater luminosus]